MSQVTSTSKRRGKDKVNTSQRNNVNIDFLPELQRLELLIEQGEKRLAMILVRFKRDFDKKESERLIAEKKLHKVVGSLRRQAIERDKRYDAALKKDKEYQDFFKALQGAKSRRWQLLWWLYEVN
ncbi:hypothetical protein [Vibrio harveyi]